MLLAVYAYLPETKISAAIPLTDPDPTTDGLLGSEISITATVLPFVFDTYAYLPEIYIPEVVFPKPLRVAICLGEDGIDISTTVSLLTVPLTKYA